MNLSKHVNAIDYELKNSALKIYNIVFNTYPKAYFFHK